MHLATQRANVPGCEISISFSTFTPAGLRPTQDYWVRYALTDIIFAGVCERYPRLKIGSVEHEISWAPHWLQQMDYTYTDRPVYAKFKSKEGLLPSDYWRRNMFACFRKMRLAFCCDTGSAWTPCCGATTSHTRNRRGRNRWSSWRRCLPGCLRTNAVN